MLLVIDKYVLFVFNDFYFIKGQVFPLCIFCFKGQGFVGRSEYLLFYLICIWTMTFNVFCISSIVIKSDLMKRRCCNSIRHNIGLCYLYGCVRCREDHVFVHYCTQTLVYIFLLSELNCKQLQ